MQQGFINVYYKVNTIATIANPNACRLLQIVGKSPVFSPRDSQECNNFMNIELNESYNELS